jgi:hypothetical protein
MVSDNGLANHRGNAMITFLMVVSIIYKTIASFFIVSVIEYVITHAPQLPTHTEKSRRFAGKLLTVLFIIGVWLPAW